ncbi:TIM barrel protein [Paenibacillus sp. RC67]|uniref:sugar phosphate isomerase/epimerase family protein n=1 Tax=Paenibacillus sp. RC67 TaxID=3039392 RepID=UPI0024AD43DD|nr:TIM barrel protein [Paenibacillus sp. RC67]
MMSSDKGNVYFGTILLERNRWAAGKEPSYLVSEWIPRLKQDGFDGIELWENHAALCDAAELERLSDAQLPVSVYNSYVTFEDGAEESRKQAAELIRVLGAKAVKFNFGREQSLLDTYTRNWNEWVKLLPGDCRLLCECHPNTVMEEPQAAAAAMKAMDRCEAIVHPFHSLGPLEEWFEHLGSAVTHAHVQYRYGGQTFRRLSSNQEEIVEKLNLMKQAGFNGSFTLEFVEGTGQGEEHEKLYEAALDDRNTLKNWITTNTL